MTDILITEEEQIFNQPIIKDWTLNFFYNYENVPQHYAYQDGLIKGELTELEKRNKAITEGIWQDAYNVNLTYYAFLYRKHALQMPLQAYLWGAKNRPPESSEGRVYRTEPELRAALDAWMEKEGWQLDMQTRQKPAIQERRILLGAPDRTLTMPSVVPVGNRVILECVLTWTEKGIIKETVFVVVLLYDIDGTVLMDRSYCDTINWPASPGTWPGVRGPQDPKAKLGQTKGWLDSYYERYRHVMTTGVLSAMEKRNKELTEGAWLNAYNTNSGRGILHPERLRVQLPQQNISYNSQKSQQIEARVKQTAPDREMRLVDTHAKGNQVIAEGIVSWTEDGVYKENPFLTFLLFDKDGLVIRDRRYINTDHWPGGRATIY